MVLNPGLMRQIESEIKSRLHNKKFSTKERTRYLISLAWDAYERGDHASAQQWFSKAKEHAIHGPRVS